MSPQTTEQITSTPPPVTSEPLPLLPKLPARELSMRQRRLFWGLLGLGAVLNVLIVYIGWTLFSVKTEKADSKRTIAVPYASAKPTLDSWRQWVVLDEGRLKPFGTFSIESVRFVTGREKFEKNDPVAVVLAWMMTYEGDKGVANRDRIREISAALRSEDWEDYPFILCDYQELRQQIFSARKPAGQELDNEEKYGKYIKPSDLRSSRVFEELVAEGRRKRQVDEKAALPMLESKASEVRQRLSLFDRICNASAFGVVPLDEVGSWWFPIDHMKFLASLPAEGTGTPHGEQLTAQTSWKNWLENERRKQAELYKGTKVQPYPEQAVKTSVAAFAAVKKAYQANDESGFGVASDKFFETITEVSKQHKPAYPITSTVALELAFNKNVPFQKAWIFCALGGVVLALYTLVHGRFSRLGTVLYCGGFASFIVGLASAVYGFYCRVSIAGRPPVSDMYETIIFVSSMTGLFAVILELIYRRGYIALVGSVVATLGFVLADQLPNTFSPNIKPLNAVLRSQYWLIVHVMTIVSSYAAMALAWGLGNLNIALILYRPDQKDLIKTLSHYSYKAIQVGVILLFFGTMLGGWWAAESWGRFWGWDNKEVWALIAFIAYIIPLHARYVGWVKDFGLAACSVICFAFVVGSWYGVNFIFPAGLHSYGFGAGNNDWVYFFGLINVSLVVHAGLRYISRGHDLASANGD